MAEKSEKSLSLTESEWLMISSALRLGYQSHKRSAAKVSFQVLKDAYEVGAGEFQKLLAKVEYRR